MFVSRRMVRGTHQAGRSPSRAASCRRRVIPSFWNALRRWYSTVLMLTTSSSAISRLLRPAAASRATTSSCEVSRRGRGRRAGPGAAPSRPAPVAPLGVGRRAQRVERGRRAREQLRRPATRPGAAQEAARGQLDPGPLERQRTLRPRRGPARRRASARLGPARGGLHPARAPAQPGDRRAAAALGGPLLVRDQQGVGLLDPADADQPLGVQVLPRPEARLVDRVADAGTTAPARGRRPPPPASPRASPRRARLIATATTDRS